MSTETTPMIEPDIASLAVAGLTTPPQTVKLVVTATTADGEPVDLYTDHVEVLVVAKADGSHVTVTADTNDLLRSIAASLRKAVGEIEAETSPDCDAINPEICACTAAARAARATQATPTIELHTGERLMRRAEAADHMTMWCTESVWLPFVESEDGDITGPGHQDKDAFAAAVLAFYEITDPEYVPETDLVQGQVAHRWVLVAVNDADEWRCQVVPEGTPGAIAVTTVWGL